MIEEIVIPQSAVDELEAAAARYRPQVWTGTEDETLKAYWLKVPMHLLEKHCHHGTPAIDRRAEELGLPPRVQRR